METKAVSRKTGFRRLLKLADYVAKLPRKRFNFNHWVGDDWKGAADFSCGTSGCALGWATTMPFFRKLGLTLTPSGYPKVKGFKSFISGAEVLFGISESEVNYLFIPGQGAPQTKAGETTAKMWARHARKFVAKGMSAENQEDESSGW